MSEDFSSPKISSATREMHGMEIRPYAACIFEKVCWGHFLP